MRISHQTWLNYIKKLDAIDSKAADMMQEWVEANGLEDRQALVEYAYALTTKYGEAAAALACEMYDATALASGVTLPAAVPAETPTIEEVGRAVNGSLRHSQVQVPSTVYRLTKQSAADTTLQNAARDGAQFAWIPYGDTCPFCITLASRGWQYMSKKALKGGHAEHIHANCDCQYGVRFSEKDSVAGYDPRVYEDMYYGAEGSTPQERINSMRRAQYQQNRDHINEMKRAAYAARVEKARDNGNMYSSMNITEQSRRARSEREKYGDGAIFVDEKYIASEEYKSLFSGLTSNSETDEIVYNYCKDILYDRTGTKKETLVILDRNTGDEVLLIKELDFDDQVTYLQEHYDKIADAKERGIELFAIHNHPTGWPPTADDCVSAMINGYSCGITCGHNGTVWIYDPSEIRYSAKDCVEIHNIIAEECEFERNIDSVLKIWQNTLEEFGMHVHERR